MLRANSVLPMLAWSGRLLVIVLAAVWLPCIPSFGDEKQHADQTQPQGDIDVGTSEEAVEVFQTALESISRNYQYLKSVTVTFETISIDPSVERREKISGENKNGLHWSTTVAPVFVGRNTVSLEGRNLRSESYDRVGSEWTHVSTWVRKGDVWTSYMPASNWAQRKLTEQLGSFLAVDPRDFGGLDQRYGLLEQMRRSEAKSISRRDGVVHLVAEIVNAPKYGYKPGQRFTYTFDTGRNFLPTQVIRHHANGSINVLTELSYEEVVPGASWFVREMTQKYFNDDVSANSSDSDAWHQLRVHKAVGPIRVNEELHDDFKIDIPPEVRLR